MRKFLCVLVSFFIILFCIASCVPENVENNNESSGVTLSGNVRGKFETSSPTNEVTVFLVDENDINDDRIYSASNNVWTSTIPSPAPSLKMIAVAYSTRYTTYSISGISPGTYYLCATIGGTDVYGSINNGPTQIDITGDTTADILY